MNSGSIRGDRIYPPGVLKVLDLVGCFPFEDPVVVVKVSGSKILEVLEHGLGKLPALEGRFPQVSNISLIYDPSREPGSRIISCKVGGEDIILDKKYTCGSRAYLVQGGDGYKALVGSEVVVDEENGILPSMIIRQYFMSLKAIGKWQRSGVFRQFFGGLKQSMTLAGELGRDDTNDGRGGIDKLNHEPATHSQEENVPGLVKKMGKKWARVAGMQNVEEGEEYTVDWTRSVAPKVEGRIQRIS